MGFEAVQGSTMDACLTALLSGSGVSVRMRQRSPAAASCPAQDRAVSTTGAGPVCNRNRVPVGDRHDGLWGQVAVWPSSLVRVAWGARSASALSPLASGSHDLLWHAREARPVT